VPRVVGATGAARVRMSRDALIAWGERLGRSVEPPSVIAVAGDLGAGKTTLIQAICRGFGVADPVTSPTFTIVQEYLAGPPHPGARVYHLDLYRIDPGVLGPLDWDAIVESDALVLVEWPERAGARLPRGHRALRLAHVPPAEGADLRDLVVG
jgi:tRNA threonylcarbamoyladenosine biosynthesis protein TsaE